MIRFNVKRFEMDPEYFILAVNETDLTCGCGKVESVRWADIKKWIDADCRFRERDRLPTHIALKDIPSRDRDEIMVKISEACDFTSSFILETILTKMREDCPDDYLVIDLRDKTLGDRERSFYIHGNEAPSTALCSPSPV